jgi:hypothetical protein
MSSFEEDKKYYFIKQKTFVQQFLDNLSSFLEEKTASNKDYHQILERNVQWMNESLIRVKGELPTNDIADFTNMDIIKVLDETDRTKFVIHKHLLFGYLYLVQHFLEGILIKDMKEDPLTFSGAQIDVNTQVLKNYYEVMDTYRQSFFDEKKTQGGKFDVETMGLLLKYIALFKVKLDAEVEAILSKNASQFTEEDLSHLRELLKKLMERPTEEELAEYNAFFGKLQNLVSIINNLETVKNKVRKEDIEEEEYLKDKHKLDTIVKTVTKEQIEVLDNSPKGIVEWLKQTIRLDNLVERNGQPSKEDVLSKKDASVQLDPFYYALVDLYERLSGAVRVYIRTKDVIDGVPITFPGENMIDEQNGILKDYRTNKVSLSLANTQVTFGPFYKIVPTATTNKELISKEHINMNNFVAMYDKAFQKKKKLNLVFFTYGYSGSGKTWTLFNQRNDDTQGILYQIQDIFRSKGYTMEFEDYCKNYGYLSGSVFKGAGGNTSFIVPSDKDKIQSYQQDISKFVREQIEVTTLPATSNLDKAQFLTTLNPDAFIKSTPNNPQSSRGFLILWFKVTSANGTNVGRVGFIDMAGNEDPYDLLVKLFPTLRWPTIKPIKSEKTFLDKSVSSMIQNYGAIDVVCSLLQEQIFRYISPIIKFIAKMLRITSVNIKFKRDEIEKYGKDKDHPLLNPVYAELKEMLSRMRFDMDVASCYFDLESNSEEDNELVDTLNLMNVQICSQVMHKLLEFYEDQSKSRIIVENLSGPLKNYPEIIKIGSIKDVSRVYKIEGNALSTHSCRVARQATRIGPYTAFVRDPFGTPYTVKFDVDKIRNDLKSMQYDPLFFKINDINSDRTTVTVSAELGDPESDVTKKLVKFAVKYEIQELSNGKRKGKLPLESRISKANLMNVNDIVLDLIRYNEKTINKDLDQVDADCDLVLYTLININKTTMDAELLIDLLKYVSLTKYLISLIKNTASISDKMYKKPLVFQFVKPPAQVSLDFSVDNTCNAVFNEGFSKKTEGKVFKDQFTNAVVDTRDEISNFLMEYFNTITREVTINKYPYPFLQDYLLRIVQEGFFINQANAELVEFLKKKKEEGQVATPTLCTDISKEWFCFENYDKFRDITEKNENCKSFTNLVPTLQEIFEKDGDAKYIMLCNIRREEDIKFRLGAIDTLKLVEKLKST